MARPQKEPVSGVGLQSQEGCMSASGETEAKPSILLQAYYLLWGRAKGETVGQWICRVQGMLDARLRTRLIPSLILVGEGT